MLASILPIAIPAGAALFLALLLGSIAAPRLRVWPLPDPEGPVWRLRRGIHRASGAGIAALSAGVLVQAGIEGRTLPLASPWLRAAGAALAICGALLGWAGFRTLGPARSFGEPGALVARGPYRWSRNPQYVGAVALMLGACIALGAAQALLGAAACSAWFLLAPWAEEPWLREKLAADYAAYHASAPRYLGWPARPRI